MKKETDLPEEKNDLYEACKNECLRLQQMIIKLQDREEILKGAYENALNRIEELKHKDEKMNEEKKQAIRPEELRIGNWLYNSEFEGNTQIYAHGIAKIAQFKDHPYSAIPLSPEWLERLGFKRVVELGIESHWIPLTDLGNESLHIFGDGSIDLRSHGHEAPLSAKCCKQLHQLQNLYFALTGQELRGCLLK